MQLCLAIVLTSKWQEEDLAHQHWFSQREKNVYGKVDFDGVWRKKCVCVYELKRIELQEHPQELQAVCSLVLYLEIP